MPVDPQLMRDTLRLWASGVSVVTTATDTARAGMTVSAFSSLCLEPPLIVVCLYKDTTVANLIPESGVFAVSILHEDAAYLSDRFAGRIVLFEGEDRFDGVPTMEAATGSPVLMDSIAWIDCKLHAIYDGASHWIVIGEAVDAGFREANNAPLVYFDRDYRRLDLPRPVSEAAPETGHSVRAKRNR